MQTNCWSENTKGREHLGYLEADGRILTLISRDIVRDGHGLDSTGSGQRPMTVHFDHRDKHSDSIKGGDFLTWYVPEFQGRAWSQFKERIKIVKRVVEYSTR
jgi:hypothetical protein